MGLIPAVPGTNYRHGGFLRGQHDLVDRPLLRAELAIGREGTGDIAGVAIELAAGVDQHQIAIADLCRILGVMQDAAVDAGRHDRRVRR